MKIAARVIIGFYFFCGLFTSRTVAGEPGLGPGPILGGTINVVIADDQGIVVLSDSMVTETRMDEHGVRISRQRKEPGQKLFQIDDRTVCTIAGFAAADTPSVPDFLNNDSAIMGRYEDSLKTFPSMSVADKLHLLQAIFSHYLMGVANLRNSMSSEGDYYLQLLIAGYDPDGTPEIGGLMLQMVSDQESPGRLFHPVTLDLRVFPVPASQPPMVLLAGKRELATQFLKSPIPWRIDEAVLAYEDSVKLGKPLALEQMKALAITLKQHTADTDKEVGGDNQIAILSAGRIQSIEQPTFAPISPVGFKFQILVRLGTDGSGPPGSGPGNPMYYPYGMWAPGFPLYFESTFKRVRQDLDDSYYSGNVFRECLLTYNGGRIDFETSNQVIDSDLLLGPKASRDSPEVKQLLKDFKWRSVKSPAEMPRFSGALMFFGQGRPSLP